MGVALHVDSVTRPPSGLSAPPLHITGPLPALHCDDIILNRCPGLLLLFFPCSFPCPVPRRRSICLRRVSVRLFILVSPIIGLSNFHIRKLLQRCRVSLTPGNVLLLHCLVSEKWEPAHSTHIITSAVAVVSSRRNVAFFAWYFFYYPPSGREASREF